MNYTEVLDLIETNLATASNITAAEHREVEIALLNYGKTQNNYVGYMTGVNLPVANGVSLTVNGDITSAVGTTSDGILVTLTTAMPSTNYYVRSYIESLGTFAGDTEIRRESFRKVSSTQFYYIQSETNSAAQNLKVHFEVISLD